MFFLECANVSSQGHFLMELRGAAEWDDNWGPSRGTYKTCAFC